MKLGELVEKCKDGINITVQDRTSGSVFARFEGGKYPRPDERTILDREVLSIERDNLEGKTFKVVISR